MSKKRDGVRPMSEERLEASFEKDGVRSMIRLRAGTPAWERVPEPWKSKAVEALWVDDELKAISERWYKTRNWWVMDREHFRSEGAWACTVGSKMAWIGAGQASRVTPTARLREGDREREMEQMLGQGTRGTGKDALDDVRRWRVAVVVVAADGGETEKDWWMEDGTRQEIGGKLKELKAALLEGERLICVPVMEKGWEPDAACVAMSRVDRKTVAREGRVLEKEMKNRARTDELLERRAKVVARSKRAAKGWATRRKKARGPARLARRLMKAGGKRAERRV